MKTLLEKGTYYIGDPCYVFNESWENVLHETQHFNEANDHVLINGYKVVGGSTAYGDGKYFDNTGKSYYVDAGLIAILPVALLSIDNKTSIEEVEKSDGMHIVTFENDFTAETDNGVFYFGYIVIDTKGTDEDDED